MSDKETLQPQQDGFAFTENERLFDRISHDRFEKIFNDEASLIHNMGLSANNYGEFLFVTASRPSGQGREVVTFWGLGLHEMRERWLHEEWFYYSANVFSETMKKHLDRDEARELLQQRLDEIAPYIPQEYQTRRGQLFELLADLTDEDGAYIEMDDLDDF